MVTQACIQSHYQGHPINIEQGGWKSGNWVHTRWTYADTGEETQYPSARPCKSCNKHSTLGTDHYSQGPYHDACIVELPGVSSACCGHGVDPPHVVIEFVREVLRFPTGTPGDDIRAIVVEYHRTGKIPAWVSVEPFSGAEYVSNAVSDPQYV